MQNFSPLAKKHQIIAFSSLRPLSLPKNIPIVKLFSPVDLDKFPKKMAILNRLFTDAHYLFGFENKLAGFDIAHAAETYYHYTQQCLNAKKFGFVKRVVATVWEIIPFANEGIWGRKEFKKRAISEIDLFIVPTRRAKDALIEEGCLSKKIKLVRMGVDLKKFKPQTFKRSGLKTILFVGRLEKEKGVWELLTAFKDLERKNRIKLIMVGDGTQKKKILNWIKNNFLEKSVFIHKTEYKKMPNKYRAADVFVLPSKPTKTWQEQYGMVLVEAMACGLPIVATRCGAIPEVVGKAAILIEPGRTDKLYRGIEELIKSKQKREVLGKRARARAEKFFNIQKTAKKLDKIYQNLMRRSKEGNWGGVKSENN